MPYLYTGQRQDPESGLWYFKNRVYDGESGRFLRRDLIGYSGGPLLYRYAGGNPAMSSDPLGLDQYCPGKGICGKVDPKSIVPLNPNDPDWGNPDRPRGPWPIPLYDDADDRAADSDEDPISVEEGTTEDVMVWADSPLLDEVSQGPNSSGDGSLLPSPDFDVEVWWSVRPVPMTEFLGGYFSLGIPGAKSDPLYHSALFVTRGHRIIRQYSLTAPAPGRRDQRPLPDAAVQLGQSRRRIVCQWSCVGEREWAAELLRHHVGAVFEDRVVIQSDEVVSNIPDGISACRYPISGQRALRGDAVARDTEPECRCHELAVVSPTAEEMIPTGRRGICSSRSGSRGT